MKNIFYFHSIGKIGGIEQFFFYLSRIYSDWDITILYSYGDNEQIERLRDKVRCEQFHGTYECDRVFYCFNYDVREFIHAKEENLVLHGDYGAMMEQGDIPKACYILTDHFDHYYGVSPTVCRSWTALTGKKCELIWNPFFKEEPKKILRFVYCGRLTREKGGDIAERFFRELEKRNIEYELDVWSNGEVKIPHSVKKGTRLDVCRYLNKGNYDFIIVPSHNEGYCYSLVQALANGLPAIVTPCPVFTDLGVDKTNSISIDFDLSNIEEVTKRLYEKFDFTFVPPKDTWGEKLAKGESDYRRIRMKIKAKTDYYDTFEKRNVSENEIYETTDDRAKIIADAGYGEIVEEVKPKKKGAKK